jgi:hypothetical protein
VASEGPAFIPRITHALIESYWMAGACSFREIGWMSQGLIRDIGIRGCLLHNTALACAWGECGKSKVRVAL